MVYTSASAGTAREFLFELRGQPTSHSTQRSLNFQQAVAQVCVTRQSCAPRLRRPRDFGFTLFVVSNDLTALQQDLRILVGIVDG